MPKKAETLLKLLSLEKNKLEERIEGLLREKEVLINKIKQIKPEILAANLMQEREELEERIVSLKQEQEDVTTHRKIVEIIGELNCPKNFQCYKKRYDTLCNAAFKGKPNILHCLEEAPGACIFSLSYRDTYYCQCPLRNYIAESVGK